MSNGAREIVVVEAYLGSSLCCLWMYTMSCFYEI
jgi:hypothetical protein